MRHRLHPVARSAVRLLLLSVFVSLAQAQEAQPPVLLFPYNQSDVTDRFVVWSWFMQPKATDGEDVICDLTVVEVIGQQSPEEAFRNNPPVIQKQDLRTTVWQENVGVRSFLPGHRYAWRITAHVGPRVVSESEIWTFTYAQPVGRDTTGEGTVQPTMPLQNPPPDTAGQSVVPGPHSSFSLAARLQMLSEGSNTPGDLSQAPANFVRLQLDPTITINGAPLELSFLLTTEKNSSETTLNRGTFSYQRSVGGLGLGLQQRIGEDTAQPRRTRFDLLRDTLLQFRQDTAGFDQRLDSARALRRNTEESIKRLDALSAASESQGILLDIPAFGFGAVTPRFTDLTLNAVTLNGGFVEYNPGLFYMEAVLGKLERQVDLSRLPAGSGTQAAQALTPQFFSNLYGLRLGYGQREQGNVILSLLYSLDDEQSRLLERLLDTGQVSFAPRENFVLGLSGQEQFDGLGLSLSGEVNVSLLTERTQGFTPPESRMHSLVSRLFGRNNVHEQSLGDLAYALRAAKLLFGSHARASAEVRMVGPSYRTVGISDLRSDIFAYTLKYDHDFLNNQLTVGGTYENEKTGFVLETPSISRVQKLGLSLGYRPPSLPSLQLSFADDRQDQKAPDDPDFKVAHVRLYSVGSQYPVRFGTIRSLSAVSFTLQKGNSEIGVSTFTSSALNVSTQMTFSNPLTVLLSFTRTRTTALTDSSAGKGNILSGTISLLYNVIEPWENGLGLTYTTDHIERTRGIFFSSNLRLARTGSVEFRWEYTEFINDPTRIQGSVDRILRLIARFDLG